MVPVPRSSLSTDDNWLWLGREIANIFVKKGLGKETALLLERGTPIRNTSSFTSSEDRPLVQEHVESLISYNEILHGEEIFGQNKLGFFSRFLLTLSTGYVQRTLS